MVYTGTEMPCILLKDAGIPFQRQVRLPMYDGTHLDVDEIDYEHEATIRTYMHMSSPGKGLLFNFNTVDFRRERARSFARPSIQPWSALSAAAKAVSAMDQNASHDASTLDI